MFLPKDIDEKQFSRTLGGYSPREVDEYLSLLKCEFEKLSAEIEELRGKTAEVPVEVPGGDAGAEFVPIDAAPDDEYGEDETPSVMDIVTADEFSVAINGDGPEHAEELGSDSQDEDGFGEIVIFADGGDAAGDKDAPEDADASETDETADVTDEPEANEAADVTDDPEADETADATDESEADEAVDTTDEPEADETIDGPENAGPEDITFEDLEEGLLRMFGDWRAEDPDAEPEDAPDMEAEDGGDADVGDEEYDDDGDAENGGADADANAGVGNDGGADEIKSTVYKKRYYRMRKKDDDADFELHEFDEYKYLFGDNGRKK